MNNETNQEFTNAEIEHIDFVHNEIHDLINRLNPKGTEVEWDMEVIGQISDIIEEYFVSKKICTDMEFCPYRES